MTITADYAIIIVHLHSSMERLKVSAVSAANMCHIDLHSSMERLKDTADLATVRKLEFTFQYGEIKSCIVTVLSKSTIKFTFQYGEIKRVDCRKNGLL